MRYIVNALIFCLIFTTPVMLYAGSFEGKLTEIVDDKLVLQWKVREPKPIGKGKVTVEKREVFPIDNISEAKVKIIF